MAPRRSSLKKKRPLIKIRKGRKKPSRMAHVRSSRPQHGFRGTKSEPDNSRRNAATQRAILAAAARLVRRQGYNRVTIEAVAAEAGAGKQTIYRWWKTKAALFAELLDETAPARPRAKRPPPLKELRAAVATLAQASASPLRASIQAGLIAEAAGDPAAAKSLQARLEAQIDMLKAILTRARNSRALRKNADIDLAAEQLVASLWFRGVVSGKRSDRRFSGRLVSQIVRGLKP
jgi:AcrR family transcriptional regulator